MSPFFFLASVMEISAFSQEVIRTFPANDTIRYFSLVPSAASSEEHWMMIAKRIYRRRKKGHDYLVTWARCDSTLACLWEKAELLSRWYILQEANVAHNTAWFSAGDTLGAIGGRDDPNRRGRDGVRYVGIEKSLYVGPMSFRGSHPGCVERREGFDGKCEFDGKFSVARFRGRWYVYGRANTRANSTRGSFGGRHIQMALMDPSRKTLSSPFRLCRFAGYPEEPGPRDNIYFGAVKENPVDSTSLIGLFPVVSSTVGLSCVAVAFSSDGLSFSAMTPLFESRAVDDGQRTVDHPVDGFITEGNYVHFFVHAAVTDVGDPLVDGPPRIVRHSVHREYLTNLTRHARLRHRTIR